MFLALPLKASLVETARTTGFRFRRWLLTARVTGSSVIPFASLARVLPVQGATSKRSVLFWGPMGSAPGRSKIGGQPQISVTRARKSAAFPKRVSVAAAAGERMGRMEKPCLLHSSMAVNVREKVQKEPQTANPRRISDTGVPPFGQDVPDGAGEDGGRRCPGRSFRAGTRRGWHGCPAPLPL